MKYFVIYDCQRYPTIITDKNTVFIIRLQRPFHDLEVVFSLNHKVAVKNYRKVLMKGNRDILNNVFISSSSSSTIAYL